MRIVRAARLVCVCVGPVRSGVHRCVCVCVCVFSVCVFEGYCLQEALHCGAPMQ